MTEYIDKTKLASIKFHPVPYTHITPSDCDAESYKRGWNDAVDAIIESEPTVEVVESKKGKWINERQEGLGSFSAECSLCGKRALAYFHYFYCPNCGADMREDNG